jgi:predicted MPP superfamily phosphohydrolase
VRRRYSVLFTVISLLGLFNAAMAARAFPSHPAVAAVLALLTAALFVGWQIAYRAGALPEDPAWARVFAWAASFGMGLWATFLILSLIGGVSGLALAGVGAGAALAGALPAAVAGASLLIAGLGFGQAMAGPRVERIFLPVEGLPPDLKGLRIAQISDLHVGPTIRAEAVQKVVDRVLALKPDLIAITGDLADGTPERLARHVAPLARLKAPLGVYYVTGNHEYYWGAEAWIDKIRALGLTPLVNENRVVARGAARLLVGGITDESGGAFVRGHRGDSGKAAATEEKADFRLLLAHRPDGVPAAERAGFDLQLSGHTHGGQFFPASLFIGLFHRHARGLSRHGRMAVYVNRGTGYWGPAHRFAVPSEITLLTLTGDQGEPK